MENTKEVLVWINIFFQDREKLKEQIEVDIQERKVDNQMQIIVPKEILNQEINHQNIFPIKRFMGITARLDVI